MMKRMAVGLLVLLSVVLIVPGARAEHDLARPLEAKEAPNEQAKTKTEPSDGLIRQILINESIAAYSGSCPCPYSRARNGSRCGGRSAHSRAGGEQPLCFPQDVPQEMVEAYRQGHPED